MWSTVGFTCVAFVAGALSWWGPTFLYNSILVQGKEATIAEWVVLFYLDPTFWKKFSDLNTVV